MKFRVFCGECSTDVDAEGLVHHLMRLVGKCDGRVRVIRLS